MRKEEFYTTCIPQLNCDISVCHLSDVSLNAVERSEQPNWAKVLVCECNEKAVDS